CASPPCSGQPPVARARELALLSPKRSIAASSFPPARLTAMPEEYQGWASIRHSAERAPRRAAQALRAQRDPAGARIAPDLLTRAARGADRRHDLAPFLAETRRRQRVARDHPDEEGPRHDRQARHVLLDH